MGGSLFIMINIGICDFCQNAREEICKFINIYFSCHSYSYRLFEFESLELLVDFLENDEKGLDLLFTELDIQNKDRTEKSRISRSIDLKKSSEELQNAFSILRRVRQEFDELSIVLNTSVNSYAVKSFELWPLYYNVKPMSYNIFSRIMDRFIFTKNNISEESILIKNGKNSVKLYFNEISYVESQNTTIRIHMSNFEVLRTYGKLDDMERQLSNSRFLRCHKSFLINMDYVKSVDSYKFTTIFGDTVAIKQRDASKIKKRYYEYVITKEKYKNRKENLPV